MIKIFSLPARYLKSLVSILTDFKLFSACIAPGVIACVVLISSLAVFIHSHHSIYSYLFGVTSHWYNFVFHVICYILEFFASGILSLIVILSISDLFLESFVVRVFENESVGLPQSSEISVSKLVKVLVVDNLRRFSFILVLSILIFVFSFFPPLLMLVMLLSFLLMGFEIFSLPLEILKYDYKAKREHLFKNLILYMAVGACNSVVLLVPILGLFALPLSYHVVARNLAEIRRLE